MCGCNKKVRETITSNVAQAMIDQARAQNEEEQMQLSASNAIGNANSGDQFTRTNV